MHSAVHLVTHLYNWGAHRTKPWNKPAFIILSNGHCTKLPSMCIYVYLHAHKLVQTSSNTYLCAVMTVNIDTIAMQARSVYRLLKHEWDIYNTPILGSQCRKGGRCKSQRSGRTSGWKQWFWKEQGC